MITESALNTLATAIIKLDEADRVNSYYEDLYNNDPDNDQVEKDLDASYDAYYEAYDNVCELLHTITGGLISDATARRLIATKRHEIVDLINRFVA